MIPITDILTRAETLLQDPGHIRWRPPSLVDWINDCASDISNNFQNAVSEVMDLRLTEGTQQILPEASTNLLEVFCNIEMVEDPGPPMAMVRRRRGTITPVSRTVLDQLNVNWQDPDVIGYAREVQCVVDDPASPRNYLVFPGNDGTGRIEALVAHRPAIVVVDIPDPNNSPDLNLAATYAGLNLDLDRKYISAVVDFVVGRAFGSDVDVPNAFNRMTYYMQSYMQRMGASEVIDQARTPQAAESVKVIPAGVAGGGP